MGNLTDILDEHWDYTPDGSIPQIGDRLRQFHRVEGFEDAIAIDLTGLMPNLRPLFRNVLIV